jgi:hypothetical protein
MATPIVRLRFTARTRGPSHDYGARTVRFATPFDSGIRIRKVLSYRQNSIPQRKPLAGIGRNRRFERRMSNRNTSRCRNHPPDVLIVPVPQFNAERQVGGDVMQVRICQLPQQTINAEIELG